jgi:serine/threonine-protein kinase
MYYGRDKRRRARLRLKQGSIAIALIGIVSLSYFLFFNSDNRSDTVRAHDASTQAQPASKVFYDSVQALARNENRQNNDAPPASEDEYEETVIPKTKEKVEPAAKKPENKITRQPTTKKLPKTFYEVVSVAHFYSKPNQQTKREDFIPYWNVSYASIRPIKEENGFIYVSVKSPLGQTSKGWLRKKDLKKVTPVYENSKE